MAIATPLDLKAQALEALNKLPPFSPTLNRLLALLASETVSYAKLADLIEKDAVLAGNVLALVNSPLYGMRGRINSVRHAISLMGSAKLKNAALSMSVTRMWNQARTPGGWDMAEFNQHAIATAMLSDMLSQEAPVEYPEGGFVAGLLHDVGRLLLAVAMPDRFTAIERLMQAKGLARPRAEQEIAGFTHADLSAEALAIWNLPEAIQTAVRYHHDPDEDPEADRSGCTLSRVVWAADQYVNSLALDHSPGSHAAQPDLDWSGPLHLSAPLPRILEEFHAEYEQVKAFF